MSISESLPPFTGAVRLFPLPNVVLFPHAMLPLQIFEPRYLAMLDEALNSDRIITMVMLQPGWEAHVEPDTNIVAGNPPIHSVGCMGVISAEQPTEDGRHMVLLQGMRRVKLDEFPSAEPFRRAQAESLEAPPLAQGEVQYRRDQLADCLNELFAEPTKENEQLRMLLAADVSLSKLTDILAYSMNLEADQKQRILAERDPIIRADLLESILRAQAAEAYRPRGGQFPPEFSLN